MQWFIVHTYSGYEQKVKNALAERIKSLGKEELFDQILELVNLHAEHAGNADAP